MFEPTTCSKVNCNHISYSKRTFYKHRNKCKVVMSYKEHSGYVHFQKIEKNKNKGQLWVRNYYSTMEDEDKELLRGCLSLFHIEITKLKRKYEEIMKLDETIATAVETMNLTRNISSETEESPRAKKRLRQSKDNTVQPSAAGWSIFGSTSTSSTD